MNHYKYAHFFLHNDLKFSPKIVMMVNNPEAGFQVGEHCFVTPYEQVYEELKTFPNVFLLPDTAESYHQVLANCDWAFFHYMPSPKRVLQLKKKYLNKIIWRTWGNDGKVIIKPDAPFYVRAARKVLGEVFRRRVERFRAIGIANAVDAEDIKKRFRSVSGRCFRLPYPNPLMTEAYLQQLRADCKPHDTLNILIGHSGHPEDRHIEILEMLRKYMDENIRVFFILSYGNQAYIRSVEQELTRFPSDKITVIKEFMDHDTFAHFLGSMDIAFLPGTRSYALGNLNYLLFYHKKVFLDRGGILHKVMDDLHIPHSCTDEIADMNFADFAKEPDMSDADVRELTLRSYKENVEDWHRMLRVLESDRQERIR